MSLLENILKIGLYGEILPFLRFIILLVLGLVLVIKKEIDNKTRIWFGILLIFAFFLSVINILGEGGVDMTTAAWFFFNLLTTLMLLTIGIILLAKKELSRKLRIWLGGILLLILISPFLIFLFFVI